METLEKIVRYGEATRKRNILPGYEYDHLFSKAPGKIYTVKRNASLSDTVVFIPKVVYRTLDQTKLIAHELKGRNTYETCRNIWHFVYKHIQYKKDEQGYEQIRSPRRTWHDRSAGVDCDCYSVFISSILTNLGIPHILRITKYKSDNFQHIYPFVPASPATLLHGKGEKEIVIDCVTDWFDYEVPYTAKKDFKMDLQFLDGIPALYRDANDLYLLGTDDGLDELGKIIKRNLAKNKKQAAIPGIAKKKLALLKGKKQPSAPQSSAQPSTPAPKKKKKGLLKKIGSVAKKALNVVNKINPVTLALRNGLLAAMKLNVMRVAQRLRWGYLTPQQAEQANIEPGKFQRLKKVVEKLEKIFYGAGGKPANLKKAILTGKGNQDKKVPLNGLEGLGSIDFGALDYMDVYTPLPQLLGPEIYYSENIEGFNGVDGLDGLGELGAAAVLPAVMGPLTAIAAAIKQIGNIFKGKGQGAADFDENINEAAENNMPVPGTTTVPDEVINTAAATAPTPSTPLTPDDTYVEPVTPAGNSTSSNVAVRQAMVASNAVATEQAVTPAASVQPEETYSEDTLPVQQQTTISITAASSPGSASANTGSGTGDQKQTFWDKNKKWIKPVGIGVAVIAVGAIGYSMMKNKKPKNKSSPDGLSGLPGKRKNHQRKKKRKPKQLQSVALI